MTDDEHVAQIQERSAQRHRGSESGATMTRDQADIGFLLRRLAGALDLLDESRRREDELIDALQQMRSDLDDARSEVSRLQLVANLPNRCGQVNVGLGVGDGIGPCLRGAGHPEDVAHIDSSGAQWWPR